MMQISKVLMGLAASALLFTGCSNQKNPATSAVTQAEAALEETRPDATKFAPAELQSADATLAKMKENLAKEDYKDVLASVPQFNKEVSTLRETLVGKQTQIIAATREWETLNAEVPKAVEEIQVRVDSLASSPKLPKEVDKHEFEAAKASLETMKSTWTEATAAFSEGNATEAADKARAVQEKVQEVKGQLGMNPPETAPAPAA
jgi:predicted  nucleic acid-binding Zn-ribbon protein